jgi:hypothetical protein
MAMKRIFGFAPKESAGPAAAIRSAMRVSYFMG